MTQIYDEFIAKATEVARTALLIKEITGGDSNITVDVDGVPVVLSVNVIVVDANAEDDE